MHFALGPCLLFRIASVTGDRLTFLDFACENFRCPQFTGLLEPVAKPDQFFLSQDAKQLGEVIRFWLFHKEAWLLCHFWGEGFGGVVFKFAIVCDKCGTSPVTVSKIGQMARNLFGASALREKLYKPRL